MGNAIKTEHAGAKKSGGHWGKRTEAKQRSKKLRRHVDKLLYTNPQTKKQTNPNRPPPNQY